MSITLMMEAANTSETSANFYQTIRRNNPEDSDLHTRRLENLKSHEVYRGWNRTVAPRRKAEQIDGRGFEMVIQAVVPVIIIRMYVMM
jgi:hypothetical protein